jgi:hypothetical protein
MHPEYIDPFLADKWRDDRALIIHVHNLEALCAFVHANKGGLPWTKADEYTRQQPDSPKGWPKAAGPPFDMALKYMANQKDGDITSENYLRAKSKPLRPHVLVSNGDNWGLLSAFVPNRTVNWGGPPPTLGHCTADELTEYLNSDSVKGLIVRQHVSSMTIAIKFFSSHTRDTDALVLCGS